MVISVKNITKSYKSKACRTKVAVKKTSVGIYPTSHNHGSIKNRPVSNRGFPKMVVPPFTKPNSSCLSNTKSNIFTEPWIPGRKRYVTLSVEKMVIFILFWSAVKKENPLNPSKNGPNNIYIYTHTYLCLDHWKIPMKMARSRGGGYHIYIWNLFVLYFWASTLQNKALSNKNKGHLGSRYIHMICIGPCLNTGRSGSWRFIWLEYLPSRFGNPKIYTQARKEDFNDVVVPQLYFMVEGDQPSCFSSGFCSASECD